MNQMKSFVYNLQYKGKCFDYYSIFDNSIVNYTHIRAERMTRISSLEMDLLKHEPGTVQGYRFINGVYLPLKSFLSDQNYSGKFLFLDSSNVSVRLKYVEELIDLPRRYQTVFFYCFSQGATEELQTAFVKESYSTVQISNSLFCVQKEEKDILFEKDDDVEKTINQCLSKQIFNCICQEESRIENVYSSNVYSNHYVNLRKVFSNSNISTLVTTRLLHMIMNVEQFEFDAFVCASITGACIASYLSIYIKKPVLFLRNIGPDITTDDELIVERIYPHKKYVYIFDFMCLGTEYQRIKLICALKKSSIVKSFGIAHYKKPNRKNTDEIQTLFQINEFIPGYYKCSVDEEQLIQL